MSWDITIVKDIDVGRPDLHHVTLYTVGSYTYNVGPMYFKAFKATGQELGLSDLGGRKTGDCIALLSAACEHMRANPTEYEAMNPPNKWGSYDGALAYLWDLLNACREFPDAIIEIQ